MGEQSTQSELDREKTWKEKPLHESERQQEEIVLLERNKRGSGGKGAR